MDELLLRVRLNIQELSADKPAESLRLRSFPSETVLLQEGEREG